MSESERVDLDRRRLVQAMLAFPAASLLAWGGAASAVTTFVQDVASGKEGTFNFVVQE